MNICLAYPNKDLKYTETFIRNHIDYLKPGFLLTGGQWPYLIPPGKSIFSFPLNINLARSLLKRLWPGLYHYAYTSSLKQFLIEKKIDMVLAEYGPVGARMTDGCMEAGVPIIVQFLGFDAFNYNTLRKYSGPYIKMFAYARKVIVVSEDMKNQLVSLGLDSHKIENISCGVDVNLYSGSRPAGNKRVFISVARLSEKKGPDKTILAFNKVHKVFPDSELWMVGDGEMMEYCLNLVREHELEEAVKFLGRKTPAEISELYKKSRCFVQHSIKSSRGDSEGLPVSLLEALSSGLPVVSTRHAGIVEAVQQNENGFLVNEGDINEMALYMEKIAGDPDLAGKMGENARNSILRSYSLEGQIEKLKKTMIS